MTQTFGTGAPRARLSSTEAAFAGFNLLRREPVTWAIWGGVTLVWSLLLGAVLVGMIGGQLAAFQAATAPGATPDPSATLARMGAMAPGYLVIMLLSIGFYAVWYAAVNRALLRPGDGGLAHLKLGGDEARQLGVMCLLLLVMLGVYIVVLLGVGILVGVIALALRSAGPIVTGLLSIIMAFGALAAFLFVGVRLSLASALSFDTSRIDLFGSWALTRRRFWPILGAYVLAALMLMVVYIALAVVFGAAMLGLGGGIGAMSHVFQPDMTSFGAYFAGPTLLWMVMSAIVSPLMLAVMLGVPAAAYAQIREIDGVASVFDAEASARFGR